MAPVVITGYPIQSRTKSSTPSGLSNGGKIGNHGDSDKRLGIILSVVFGIIALAIMAVLFWCLRRRKKRTGRYFRPRSRSPSSASNQPLRQSVASAASAKPSMESTWSHQDEMPVPLMPTTLPAPLPVPVPPLSDRHSRTISNNMLAVPNEARPVMARQSSSIYSDQIQHNGRPQNPFLSREDDEVLDIVSPLERGDRFDRRPKSTLQHSSHPGDGHGMPALLPAKHHSLDRRAKSMDMVHYPSASEMSEFDFAANASPGRVKSYDRISIGDGWRWHLSQERRDGRHELA